MITALLIFGWIISIYGILITLVRAAQVIFQNVGSVRIIHGLWFACGVIFIVWRLLPNFHF